LGSGDGQFYYPRGIAVDSSGHVYVMDNHIQKFDSDGRFITKWGFASGPGLLLPDIAVASSGHVYVVTICCVPAFEPPPLTDCYVWKFDSDGNFITKWGSCGTGDGQFSRLDTVAVDASGYVYVTDGCRIQKFDSNGNFVSKWGSCESGDGQFVNASGVTVDSSGNVFVTNWSRNRVQKFDSNGQFVTKWGSMGSDEGQFLHPEGIAVDFLGNVYVADTDNNRIQKFSLAHQEIVSAPTIPSGSVNGLVGSGHPFSTGSSSSDLGHPVQYRFSWGDGTYSDWSSSPVASKSWSSPGVYSVKAQARCSIDTSIESNWSAGLTVTLYLLPITLQSPLDGKSFTACSIKAPPAFSWNAVGSFDAYELQFSSGSGFSPIAIRVQLTYPQFTPSTASWKEISNIPSADGVPVYWRVIGTRGDRSTETSDVRSFIIGANPAGDPTISPTGKRSKPTLTWLTNCNTKFKIVFGSDSVFTKKTYSFEIENPTGAEGSISKTLTSLQWVRIKMLVKNKKGSAIYWYVESWDELGRYGKTDVMSLTLTD